MKSALEHALELNCKDLQVFSDSLSLINLVNEGGQHIDIYGLLEDIRDLCQKFSSISFYFISRKHIDV